MAEASDGGAVDRSPLLRSRNPTWPASLLAPIRTSGQHEAEICWPPGSQLAGRQAEITAHPRAVSVG